MYSVALLPGFACRGLPGQRAPRSALAAWLESLLALGATTAGPLGPPDFLLRDLLFVLLLCDWPFLG